MLQVSDSSSWSALIIMRHELLASLPKLIVLLEQIMRMRLRLIKEVKTCVMIRFKLLQFEEWRFNFEDVLNQPF